MTFTQSLQEIIDHQTISKTILTDKIKKLKKLKPNSEQFVDTVDDISSNLLALLILTTEFIIMAEEVEEYEVCSIVNNRSKKIFMNTIKQIETELTDDEIKESFYLITQTFKLR